MSNVARRAFYNKLDSKFAEENPSYSRRAIAGTVIPAIGLPRSFEILAVADSFGMWLELSYSTIAEAREIAPDLNITISTQILNEATLFEKVCTKYGFPKEEHVLRAKAALMIKRAGTRACLDSVKETESFEMWLIRCRDLLIRKKLRMSSRKRKRKGPKKRNSRRKPSNLAKLSPSQKMKNPKIEVVGDRKLEVSRDWQRKHAKHQLADEDEKIIRRTLPKM